MSGIPDIMPHGNRPEEFAESSSELRDIADKVDKGEILSALWITVWRGEDGRIVWDCDKFKARGMSMMELQGALHQALTELAMENIPE